MISDFCYVRYCVDPDDLPDITMDDCLSLLPDGFWWRGGTCHVSSEVTVCPDHNDPEHRERLLRQCPPTEAAYWDCGIDVELRPGSHKAFLWAFFLACYRARRAMGEPPDVKLGMLADLVTSASHGR
jgi:hypothetical protein